MTLGHVIIAGSRGFPRDTFNDAIALLDASRVAAVVSGCAAGPDTWGATWARAHGVPVVEMPADWERHGKAAGPLRNADMIAHALHHGGRLLAFWDGESRGTAHIIRASRQQGLPVVVVRP